MRSRDLTTTELALAFGVPRSTCARWLTHWFSLGVRGIRREPSRGRTGARYVVTHDLLVRWRRGELPEPWPVARAA
jgi:hypothetical protein